MSGITLDEIDINETLNAALRRIVNDYKPEKIIVFGSYAYGQPDSESDLDLLIIKQTNERPIDRRIAVRTLLRPLKLRPGVSPIVVTQDEIDERLALGDPFAEELMTKGRVIYER
jgi:predicted nucleotidyltransferase